MEHSETIPPVVAMAARVKEVRKRKGLTAQGLADALKASGLPWDRQTVTKLETGRRQNISVVEWLALSRALDVSPLHLLVPLEEVNFQVTPEESLPAGRVRAWLRGTEPLPGTDERIFRSEIPLDELPAVSGGAFTTAGRSAQDRLRAEYRAATGREISDDQLLNWMLRGERPEGMDGGEQEHQAAPER
ncbi:helix-turn-helix transcriptional regulator [Streptomyces sp. NPDC086669]|uniref:helix-turn-helix transcriptional regulator n=1 Tax=Streptomyces sp. NPDC086669 TaxID=3365753 RepID=UPI00382E105F